MLQFSQSDLQNLEDASDDLLLVDDESAPIPFVVGEVFVHFNMEEAKVCFTFLISVVHHYIESIISTNDSLFPCRRKLKKLKPR